jgi:hypothetical protein
MLVLNVGDEFSYENKLHWQKENIKMFITSILKVKKKETIICKKIHMFSNTWNLNFKLLKIKGPIQVLASALEKHNYINSTFETNANNS